MEGALEPRVGFLFPSTPRHSALVFYHFLKSGQRQCGSKSRVARSRDSFEKLRVLCLSQPLLPFISATLSSNVAGSIAGDRGSPGGGAAAAGDAAAAAAVRRPEQQSTYAWQLPQERSLPHSTCLLKLKA